MNERFRKLFISSMAVLTGFLLLFPVGLWSVNAQATSVMLDKNNPVDLTNISDLLWQMPSSGMLDITGYYSSSTNQYNRLRFNSTYTGNNATASDTPPSDLFFLLYRDYNQNNNNITVLAFRTGFSSNDSSNHSVNSIYLTVDYSNDGVNWYISERLIQGGNNTYTGNGLSGYSFPVNYMSRASANLKGIPNCTFINLKSGQNYNTILQVLSYRLIDRPWGVWSNSSGGLHFENGTELNATDRSRYEQIYIVMDINHDNSVSEEEVNYYNVTYNTNYDYSEINEGNNFTELQFLEYIALLLSQGVENPGGGTGEGGGSGSVGGGGVSIGEGSFTQTQTQTIEENAVNVTVNNNNELSQENMQYLNNVINNNLGTEGNAFGDAISAISGFTAVARSFSGLVTVMFGFLPSWVLTIMGLMFTILFVFIVFRLIHLFI